jgi:hypothetical protein
MLFALACGATIVLSSFLLFMVQPILAKQILPWFGGTSAVWTVCMVFFQCALLAGYLYAHWLQGRSCKTQRTVHLVLLAAALLTLPIIPSVGWKPSGDTEAAARILGLLLATVGLPYASLAATSPLLQRWLSRALPAASQRHVYRLFAWSNAGSLAALLAYPFLVEPWFDTVVQSWAWSVGYCAFVLACGWVTWRATAVNAADDVMTTNAADRAEAPLLAVPDADAPAATEPTGAPARPPSFGHYAAWTVLAMIPSAFLLAVTTHMTQNVASIPFLWIVPLSLYLFSFMLVFEGRGGRGWYVGPVARVLWLLPTLGTAVAMTWALSAANGVLHIHYALPLFASGLLLACVICHGELAAARPAPQYLTRFYLCMSFGGALGGMGVGLVAPQVFDAYWELPGLMIAVALVGLVAGWRVGPRWRRAWSLPAVAALCGCAWFTVVYAKALNANSIAVSRNFYGVLRVTEHDTGEAQVRRLLHGTIMHGEQFTTPKFSGLPTSYYGEKSGIGRALHVLGERGPIHVGSVGLGTGTLLSYAREGDKYDVYELDTHVLDFARDWFTYLGGSPTRAVMHIGDARLSMERELAAGLGGRYDLISVDAFSSDSIPVHLMTREALGIYLKHLKPDGIVAFHVSNRYLDLVPVVAQLAAAHGVQALQVEDSPEDDDYLSYTDWVLVGKNLPPELLSAGELLQPVPGAQPWTDAYNNLFKALKF